MAVHRRCPRCDAARPAEHTFCFDCGARLGDATLPGNRKGFKSSGLPMTYGRIMTRRDRSNERPLRTWGDSLARWYFNLSLVAAAALFASSRGWIAPGLWEAVKQAAGRIGS